MKGLLLALLVALLLVLGGCREREQLPAECVVMIDTAESSRMEVEFILYGQGRTSADLYRSGSNMPIAPLAMYLKEFIDTGKPYVHQGYSTYDWEPGIYTVKYRGVLDSGERSLTLVDDRALMVHINCP